MALPNLAFGGAIWSSTDALSPTELPKRLVVVGAGYIGLELTFAYRKLGTEVTVVEAASDILPRYDEALTKPVLDALKKAGVVLHLGCSVAGWDAKSGVHVRNARADETRGSLSGTACSSAIAPDASPRLRSVLASWIVACVRSSGSRSPASAAR